MQNPVTKRQNPTRLCNESWPAVALRPGPPKSLLRIVRFWLSLPPMGDSASVSHDMPPERHSARSQSASLFRLHAGDVQVYRLCDDCTGALIFTMLVFSPWAFGTTQPWSVKVMNASGYALGFLLLVKLFLRWTKGHSPPRWNESSQASGSGRHVTSGMTMMLAITSVLLLVFTLISAVNARSTYHPWQTSFEYHAYIEWLPHSFDRQRSWFAFWQQLGLGCTFWAVWDWLLGKTESELRAAPGRTCDQETMTWPLPARLRYLLWILCVNGALLAVEGIIQRLEGSGKLLFIIQPRVNPQAEAQFGPYAYRANASQYFNMLWPVCLGFWWILHRTRGLTIRRHHWLLPCAAIMAACPAISSSRGGVLISAGLAMVVILVLGVGGLFSKSRDSGKPWARKVAVGALAMFLVVATGLGVALGWSALQPRMRHLSEGFDQREEMYELARPMATDYPTFGTGPGTFEPVFQLYRASTETYWPAQLHNDWLETRITYGWCGCALFGLALGCVFLRWFAPGGIFAGRRFALLIALGLAGCLAHARFDFPFQIHSLVFLFLTLSAILFCLTRRP